MTIGSLMRHGVERHLIWLLLLALVLLGSTIDGFLSVRNLTNVVWASAPLGCMVLGLFFVLLTGSLDLSLESTYAFAPTVAIVAVMAVVGDGGLAVLGIPIALALGVAVGLFNGVFSVRLGVNPFLVTLATLLVLRGVVIWLIPEGIYYLPDSIIYLGGARLFGTIIPVAVVVWLLLIGAAWLIVERHRIGRDIYALGNNPDAAYLAGIDTVRTRIVVFALAGFLAAMGGILEIGRLQSMTADMGQGDILMVFAAAILGGTALTGGEGRVGHIFAAVIVVAVIENLLNLIGVPPSIRQIVFGLVLLAAILLASLQGRIRLRAEDI